MSLPAQARTVFMGTPEFAVPSLEALAARYPVIGVVTQPDRPAGRGRQVAEPPVKRRALAAGLAVLQPNRLRDAGVFEQLAAWAPDLIVVAAYGQILPPAWLALPRFGCVNVHASLLPRWRGAAPVAAALLAGDAQTGVTLMQMEAGLDTGPILAQKPMAIRPDDTTATLTERLGRAGADLLLACLPKLLTGELPGQPQDQAQATYAPQLRKEAGRLDFGRPAVELERQIRAYSPWPGAFATWHDGRLKVVKARVLETSQAEPAGRVFAAVEGPAVACGDGALLLETVQPAGRKPMAGLEYLRGARHLIGADLA